jgi:hypothetical protein
MFRSVQHAIRVARTAFQVYALSTTASKLVCSVPIVRGAKQQAIEYTQQTRRVFSIKILCMEAFGLTFPAQLALLFWQIDA